MSKELLKLDLYAILGVGEDASEKQILKGYRKKALKCHPDKNPDNPKAAELFHQLSEALEILTDAAAKAAYDRSRKAKKEVDARNAALDSKRKKFKEDLEAREKAAEERLSDQKSAAAERNLQKEIERLRKEGSRLLEQEQERLREELKNKANEDNAELQTNTGEVEVPRLKLKWKAAKDDPSNGGYDDETLTKILSRYGHIDSLLVSSKRSGSAIVEFKPSSLSVGILEEKGLPETPFTVVWLSGKPSMESAQNAYCHSQATHSNPSSNQESRGITTGSSVTFTNFSSRSDLKPLFNFNGDGDSSRVGFSSTSFHNSSGEKDFESLVMMRMRQAEERKRLIAQMKKEDEENG